VVYRIGKRFFDFICALMGIIFTGPVWILSMVLILVSDWGPLFYFSNRLGKDNIQFKMWKFRSMRVLCAPKEGTESSLRPEQNRIFWWGKVMRRLKIDELPQLINVLNGTMSIVGPRPAAVDQMLVTRGGDNTCAAKLPCGLTSPSSLYDYIYGDQFKDEVEYNEKVLPTRLKLDVWFVNKIESNNCFAAWCYELKLIWWTIIAIASIAVGKYPQWLEEKIMWETLDG